MNKLSLFLSLLLIVASISAPASEIDSQALKQEIGFKLCQIRLHHQDLWRTLNIKIWYQLKDSDSERSPDTFEVKEAVIKFLADYPNQADYWEILNKKMAQFLIETYPIQSLEIELGVVPDASISAERRSLIRYEKGQIRELF